MGAHFEQFRQNNESIKRAKNIIWIFILSGSVLLRIGMGGHLMEDKKTDQRVIKTQLLLINTMLDLLQNKSFSKITVNDICKTAMVSRSTFYDHFEDKYILLNVAIDKIIRQLNEETERENFANRPHSMLLAIYKESKLFKNIFINDQSEELQKYFFNHCYSDLMELIQEQKQKGRLFTLNDDAIASFYAGGIASLTKWWIMSGFPISVDEMSDSQLRMLEPLLDTK